MYSDVGGANFYHAECQDDPVLLQFYHSLYGVGLICEESCTDCVIVTLLEACVEGGRGGLRAY